MFNFHDFLQIPSRKCYRKDVFASAPKAPVIIEWWQPHPVFPMHKHIDFEEFAIIRQGIGIHYHRDKFQLLTPGDAIFIGRENPHGYVCTHNLGLFNVVFNAEYFYACFPEVKNILTNLKALSKTKNSLRISAENLSQTLSIVYRIEYENSTHFDDYTSSSMFSLFLQIAIMLLRDNRENDPHLPHNKGFHHNNNKQSESISRIIAFIRQSIDMPISEISASLTALDLNNKTAQRYFFKHLHVTIYQYIQLQKLTFVMNAILKHPEHSLMYILGEAGYTNYRSFSRHMVNFFGNAPKDFQKNIFKIHEFSQKN